MGCGNTVEIWQIVGEAEVPSTETPLKSQSHSVPTLSDTAHLHTNLHGSRQGSPFPLFPVVNSPTVDVWEDLGTNRKKGEGEC